MTNDMNYGLQQAYGLKVGSTLSRKNFSSFALVVLIHLAVGAMFLGSLTRTNVLPPKWVPINILQPETKPVPPKPLLSELPTAKRDVIVPVIQQPVIFFDVAPLSPTSPTDIQPNSDPAPSQGVAGASTSTGLSAADAVGVACPNSREVQASMAYPAVARRAGVQGDVIARFMIGANGAIRDIAIASSSSPSLNRAVINAVAQFRCQGQGHEVMVEAPFSFRLHD